MVTRSRKVIQGAAAGIALIGLAPYVERPAKATPQSGVTVTVLSRATVPAFDVRRLFESPRDTAPRNHGNMSKIELETTQTIDVVTALFTLQPGGHSGWHTHPGPAVFTIKSGTVTMYDGRDRSCTPHALSAGTGSIEADTDRHIHLLRNETKSVAETIVTFLLPVGAAIRTDLPDPGNCSF